MREEDCRSYTLRDMTNSRIFRGNLVRGCNVKGKIVDTQSASVILVWMCPTVYRVHRDGIQLKSCI